MKLSKSFEGYFAAVARDPALANKEAIEKHIHENKQLYTYGNADYSSYKAFYNPKGYVGRKFAALPMTLWAGIAKVIYHLAIAMIFACACKGEHAKAEMFNVTRDFEEAFGWLTTLFHDKTGTYLVQESLFQKECYEEFLRPRPSAAATTTHSSWSSSRTTINGVEIPHYAEANEITLKKFKEMDLQTREATITRFRLQDDIDAIGDDFFERLAKANDKLLEGMNLVNLKLNQQTQSMKYLLMSDEEFQKVTVSQLSEVQGSGLSIIALRIGNKRTLEPDQNFKGNVLDVPLVQFYQIPGEKLSEVMDKLPENAFHFITDKQLPKLNYEKISTEALRHLFEYIDGKEERRRFALLKPEQVQQILGKLSKYPCSLISDEQLQKLDFKGLSGERLEWIFEYNIGIEERRRFALLTPEQVQPLLEHLYKYQLSLISDEQLKKLDYTNLSSERLEKIFPYIDGKEERRRFALLKPEQVQPILGKLYKYQLSLISDAQLPELDYKDLSGEHLEKVFPYIDGKEEKRRFALLKPERVQPILGKLYKYQLSLISDAQLTKLDYKDISQERLDWIFPYIDGKEEARRLNLLSPQQLKLIYDRLSKYLKSLISKDKLKAA